MAEQQGDLKTARKYYRRILDEAPRSLKRRDAQRRYEKLAPRDVLPAEDTPIEIEAAPRALPGALPEVHQDSVADPAQPTVDLPLP